MRKITMLLVLVMVLCLFLIGTGIAQVRKLVPNQSTMGWDPVTMREDGTPIPATDEVKYEVFLGPYPIPAGQDRNDPALYDSKGITDQVQWTYTFAEGSFTAGVRSLRIPKDVDGNILADPIPSTTISWSDDPVVTDNNPWYYSHFLRPAGVGGLHNPAQNVYTKRPMRNESRPNRPGSGVSNSY